MNESRLPSRYESLPNKRILQKLSDHERDAFIAILTDYGLSFSEARQILNIAADFTMWGVPGLESFCKVTLSLIDKKQQKTQLLQSITHAWENQKQIGPRYEHENTRLKMPLPPKPIRSIEKEGLSLGLCPVASKKTRCCNLLTLDAFEGCGFDCSYCAIRTFYDPESVAFDHTFPEKLVRLELDPQKRYHIGTGQSSDSLMFGNHAGILDALLAFAFAHPNVILELKTKSDRIKPLLERDLPPNLITTWSLNPDSVISHEEHRASSLRSRLDAAETLAQKGHLVGFHLHPMVWCESFETQYGEMIDSLTSRFDPKTVALVSFGALTYTKPVLRYLREDMRRSRVLQVPLIDAGGKFSYPLPLKEKMFSFAYARFTEWHGKVYFYLCMEDEALWNPVFGHSYPDNDAFESDMLDAYFSKISELKPGHE